MMFRVMLRRYDVCHDDALNRLIDLTRRVNPEVVFRQIQLVDCFFGVSLFLLCVEDAGRIFFFLRTTNLQCTRIFTHKANLPTLALIALSVASALLITVFHFVGNAGVDPTCVQVRVTCWAWWTRRETLCVVHGLP